MGERILIEDLRWRWQAVACSVDAKADLAFGEALHIVRLKLFSPSRASPGLYNGRPPRQIMQF